MFTPLPSLIVCVCVLLGPPSANTGERPSVSPRSFGGEEIRTAFVAAHGGFSSDELLVRDSLRHDFLRQLAIDPDDASQHDDQTAALLMLLKLRKSGKLDVPATRRSGVDASPWTETAELAIRTVLDRHRVSIDQIMCDPRLRAELHCEAIAVSPDAPADLVRKAVFKLRKIRRLRPELVLRVADWQTEVVTMSLDGIDLDRVPDSPGIYLFRSEEGYLYIGEAESLSVRIAQHLAGSHNTGLARRLKSEGESAASPIILELHVFAKDSPGKRLTMRRAYESELIRSRDPKFNLRP